MPRPHGRAVRFAQEWEPPDGQSQPNVLAIDPERGRVYVAGRCDRSTKPVS